MPHALWTGSLGFGLVSIPVRLYSSIGRKDVSFHQVEKDTGRSVRVRRVAEGTDEEIPYERIVKGFELDNGMLVTFTSAELKTIDVGPTGAIDVQAFVGLAEIDPIYYDQTFVVAPDKGGDGPYAWLRRVMEEAERVAVCTSEVHGKRHLAPVHPYDGRLALEVLYYPDEIRVHDGVAKPSARLAPQREKAIARQLVDALTTEWKPTDYEDASREAVLAMIKVKSEGNAIEATTTTMKPTEVTDLMVALEASLAQRSKSAGRTPPNPQKKSLLKTRAKVGCKTGAKSAGRSTKPTKWPRSTRRHAAWPRFRVADRLAHPDYGYAPVDPRRA